MTVSTSHNIHPDSASSYYHYCARHYPTLPATSGASDVLLLSADDCQRVTARVWPASFQAPLHLPPLTLTTWPSNNFPIRPYNIEQLQRGLRRCSLHLTVFPTAILATRPLDSTLRKSKLAKVTQTCCICYLFFLLLSSKTILDVALISRLLHVYLIIGIAILALNLNYPLHS